MTLLRTIAEIRSSNAAADAHNNKRFHLISFIACCFAVTTLLLTKPIYPANCIGDPATLIVIDEADRLRMASLEQVRAIFDAQEIGLILIGMPGLGHRNIQHTIQVHRVQSGAV